MVNSIKLNNWSSSLSRDRDFSHHHIQTRAGACQTSYVTGMAGSFLKQIAAIGPHTWPCVWSLKFSTSDLKQMFMKYWLYNTRDVCNILVTKSYNVTECTPSVLAPQKWVLCPSLRWAGARKVNTEYTWTYQMNNKFTETEFRGLPSLYTSLVIFKEP